jgi:hypothetical protein
LSLSKSEAYDSYPFFELLNNVPLSRFFNIKRLQVYGPKCVKQAKKLFKAGYEQKLIQVFHDACKAIVSNAKPEITTQIFYMIVSKMMNAYTGRVVKRYSILQRGGIQCTLALWPALQADGLKGKNKKKPTDVAHVDTPNEEEELNLVVQIDPETIMAVEQEL